jgi:hypothetical protein
MVVENTTNHFEHRIRALNHTTGKTSKSADAYSVRYAWQVGGVRPASGEDLPMGVWIDAGRAALQSDPALLLVQLAEHRRTTGSHTAGTYLMNINYLRNKMRKPLVF